MASAAVSPTTVEQVQQIVGIANRYKIPLYAISTGRNLGYGGSSPNLSGSVIVDLKRMNRIIEVNTHEGYMIVEPGVSWPYKPKIEALQGKKPIRSLTICSRIFRFTHLRRCLQDAGQEGV